MGFTVAWVGIPCAGATIAGQSCHIHFLPLRRMTEPMLLTITTTCKPATDLGYLLHKNPARHQSFSLSFGKAHVFYPEADDDRCTAALLLDVDPVGMVRGKGRRTHGALAQYVNDRPYVASSLMSVAIAQVFGTALNGRCKERQEPGVKLVIADQSLGHGTIIPSSNSGHHPPVAAPYRRFSERTASNGNPHPGKSSVLPACCHDSKSARETQRQE